MLTPDGTAFITGGNDGRVNLWRDGMVAARFAMVQGRRVNDVVASGNDVIVADHCSPFVTMLHVR